MFADVILPVPLPGFFTYIVPDHLQENVVAGIRVVVPFGPRRLLSGVVASVREEHQGNDHLKEINSLLDEKPILPDYMLQFWDWMMHYYLCTPGEIMMAALPSGFRLESETKIMLHPSFNRDMSILSDKEYLVAEALTFSETLTLSEVSEIIGPRGMLNLIKSLIERNVIVSSEEMSDTFSEKTTSLFSLNVPYHNEDNLKSILDSFSKRAYKQMEILMLFLQKAGNEYPSFRITRKDLIPDDSYGGSALQALVSKGIMVEETVPLSRLGDFKAKKSTAELILSPAQMEAEENIRSGFRLKKPVLLHGVTGSGKTEIYAKLISEVISQGKQVLYILPEIALTSQIIGRLRTFFGNKVQVFHSGYSENQKTELWNRIVRFEAKEEDPFVFVGARSALFLPLTNPGLIIVDEEHDHSLKQYDPAPRYHARDAAVKLAALINQPILLGSATPSAESFNNALSGKYHLVPLQQRFGKSTLPEVLIADMSHEMKNRTNKSHYSTLLLDKIQNALDQNLQVIIFQNRRGFSVRIVCETCGWYPGCPHCDVSLTYHKAIHKLKCHYCGYQMSVPSYCAECNSKEIRTVGFGTQKVEEELASLFPKAIIRRMDHDTTRTKNAFQTIIDDFENGRINILVGTQMVSKGLDFSKVALVGILDADSMMAFPDFRSSERCFQHILQVSGRAGRQEKQGTVVIQTYQPHHDLIRFACNHDYSRFFENELAERMKFGYPPYSRLIRIVCKSKDNNILAQASFQLAREIASIGGLKVLGPEYPVVARIKTEYLRHILIKLAPGKGYASLKSQISQKVRVIQASPAWKKVKFFPDVDPY
jgi:primosomal protein N' (replication factor Y) (superfamily II helicase)